jgi:ABC-type arginine/histidine transport system permease subunit
VIGAIHGTNKGEVQAAKSIGRMQFLKTRLRDITDERTIETLSRMNCNMYRSERQDKLMIDT